MMSVQRIGILYVSSRTILESLNVPRELLEGYKSVHHVFDIDAFGFMIEHPKIPEHEEGEYLPLIEIDNKDGWHTTSTRSYEEGYADGRKDAELSLQLKRK